MTREQFESRVLEIESARTKALNDLYMEFAKSNNPYKVGDIVTDHIGALQIQRISVCAPQPYNPLPCCIYRGVELKKDGTPKKHQDPMRYVYQFNIKK